MVLLALISLFFQAEVYGMLPIEAPTPGVPDHLREGWQFSSGCKVNRAWAKIESNAAVKAFLGGAAKAFNQQLPVYSCFRSQESQDEILRRNQCAPRFGTVECSGRIAANLSEHTIGVAADFQARTSIPQNSSHPVRNVEIERYCSILNQLRKQHSGGRGGITLYGIGNDSAAFMHFDAKSDWCNWGACEKIGDKQVLGEGHCKRKKFLEKEARIEASIAAAKELRAIADIRRLEAELVRLRADCKPGDLSCRDLFKD